MRWLTRVWDRVMVALRLRRPRPAILYVDRDGVGGRKPPEWLSAQWPDEGQHESWKREMRVFLWRASAGMDAGPGMIDMHPLGLSRHRESVPYLWPVNLQLAEASRRLGFSALARAAMPELPVAELRVIYDRHELEVGIEARRRVDLNQKTEAAWDARRMGGPFTYESAEQTTAVLTLGPFDGPADAQPLHSVAIMDGVGDTHQYARRKA